MANNTLNKIFFYFLISHLLIWTLIPSLSNSNLPRDTIEALAWGSNLEWGFEKHPPLSAFATEIFYQLFGSQDWAYYLLSQLFVILSFYTIWLFSKDFFSNKKYCLISLLILESIYFYNYTTPEFNVNVCQLPFWSLSIFYAWRGFKRNNNLDWLLFGFFAGLGILSKYLFVYILLGIFTFFCFVFFKKKISFKILFSLLPLTLIMMPHLLWLVENNFITVNYGMHRTVSSFYSGDSGLINNFKYPLIFLAKQIGILIPFFIMVLSVTSKLKFNMNFKDEKLIFLFCISIVPFLLIFFTSLIFGVNIRTMWMTPFYLFLGVFVIYVLKKNIMLKKFKRFIFLFLFFFILSPVSYLLNSNLKKDQRIDYPSKEISNVVQEKWEKNFNNNISIVIGQAWWAGNLSYHLESRPKFVRGHLNAVRKKIDHNQGIIYIEDESSKLTKSCPGVFFVTHSLFICMVGNK